MLADVVLAPGKGRGRRSEVRSVVNRGTDLASEVVAPGWEVVKLRSSG